MKGDSRNSGGWGAKFGGGFQSVLAVFKKTGLKAPFSVMVEERFQYLKELLRVQALPGYVVFHNC